MASLLVCVGVSLAVPEAADSGTVASPLCFLVMGAQRAWARGA